MCRMVAAVIAGRQGERALRRARAGNPAGRPRRRHREAPYETVLGQMVTIREGGTERRVTAAEAFLLQLAKRGVEGDSAAARASLAGDRGGHEPARRSRSPAHCLERCGSWERHICIRGTANGQDPRSVPKDRTVVLEPWLVEAALARLPNTESHELTNHHGGHTYTAQGQVA